MYSYDPSLQFLPHTTEIDKFVALLMASGLTHFADLHNAVTGFDTARTDATAIEDLCEHLKSKEALTDWQCGKLRSGKYKGFFVDGYCLLSQIGKTETTSTYAAKEVSTGKVVSMTFTPLAVTNGKMEYELGDLPT